MGERRGRKREWQAFFRSGVLDCGREGGDGRVCIPCLRGPSHVDFQVPVQSNPVRLHGVEGAEKEVS